MSVSLLQVNIGCKIWWEGGGGGGTQTNQQSKEIRMLERGKPENGKYELGNGI